MNTKTKRRLETLERRVPSGLSVTQQIQAGVLRPRQGLCALIRATFGTADLATSKCTRTLNKDLFLTEIVELSDGHGSLGGRDGLSDQDLVRWIESFPIEMLP